AASTWARDRGRSDRNRLAAPPKSSRRRSRPGRGRPAAGSATTSPGARSGRSRASLEIPAERQPKTPMFSFAIPPRRRNRIQQPLRVGRGEWRAGHCLARVLSRLGRATRCATARHLRGERAGGTPAVPACAGGTPAVPACAGGTPAVPACAGGTPAVQLVRAGRLWSQLVRAGCLWSQLVRAGCLWSQLV